MVRAERLTPITRLSPFLFPAEREVRANNLPESSSEANRVFPAIGAHRLRNAYVTANRRCSAAIVGSRFLVPEATQRGPWRIHIGMPITGGILWQRGQYLLVDLGEKNQSIDKAIFVGSWSPHNWFHWTIDTLPGVWLSSLLPEEFTDFPILLPEESLRKSSWIEPLELVRGGRKVITLPGDEYAKVKDLIWVDSPSSPGPLPALDQGGPRYSLHGSAINAYRSHIIEALGIDELSIRQADKIYIARGPETNRPDNQDELIQIAEKFGFRAVYFENLNLREAVRTMLGARELVGPHGAGWANALFCQPGVKAFMWTWAASKPDNWFANIAAVRNIDFNATTDVRHSEQVWRLSPSILSGYLKKSQFEAPKQPRGVSK